MDQDPQSPPETSKPGSPIALTNLFSEEIAYELGLKPFQGRQVFQWLHQKRVFDFGEMTNLSKELRQRLNDTCVAAQLRVHHVDVSRKSSTRKALFCMRDGEMVESVFLRDRDRVTLCLSSQAGCALNCAFCATGRSGFRRNLSAGEIAEQALHMVGMEDLADRTPNIVYMGMGEPFQNYDEVLKSIRLLMAEDGMSVGARKITVSTAGHVPGIERFAKENWQVRLAVSLHAANDRLRSQLMPLNRKYPLETLLHAVRSYVATTGRQVSFEWTLMSEVNDSPKDAEELACLIGDLKAVVNLIPYNPIADAEYVPSSPSACETFREALIARGIEATLRQERGQDIAAACGQLRLQRL